MKCFDAITKASANASGRGGNGWGDRHVRAWQAPCGPERPIRSLIVGLAQYADTHRDRFESDISEDYLLGRDYWLSMWKGARGLLNGELGRLDGGTLDGLLIDILEAAGFEEGDA